MWGQSRRKISLGIDSLFGAPPTTISPSNQKSSNQTTPGRRPIRRLSVSEFVLSQLPTDLTFGQSDAGELDETSDNGLGSGALVLSKDSVAADADLGRVEFMQNQSKL